jgi:hypothetical protein
VAKRGGSKVAVGVALALGLTVAAAPVGATVVMPLNQDVNFHGRTGGGRSTNPVLDNLLTLDGSGVEDTGGSLPEHAIAAVPEPAGWLMMLFGFGILGAITRRSPTPLEAQRAL